MTVAVDTTSALQSFSATNTHSWSHTASGSDRYVRVKVTWFNGSNTLDTITYGGNAMTLVGTARNATGGESISIYELIAPPTGSQTVSLTWSANVGGRAYSRSYTGVHQTTASRGTPIQTTGNGTAISDDATSESGDVVDDLITWDSSSTTATVGAGQTTSYNDPNVTACLAGSTEDGAASTTTMSWTLSVASNWSHVASAIIAAAAGGPTIDTQPSDVSTFTRQTANFTVSATASAGSLTYQWQVSTNRCVSYSNVSSGTGDTTNSYTTASLGFADDETFYRCAVTDSNGTTNTRGATLRVGGEGAYAWTIG